MSGPFKADQTVLKGPRDHVSLQGADICIENRDYSTRAETTETRVRVKISFPLSWRFTFFGWCDLCWRCRVPTLPKPLMQHWVEGLGLCLTGYLQEKAQTLLRWPSGCCPEDPSVETGLLSHPSVMLTGHKQNTQTLTSVGAILNTRRDCRANTPRRTRGVIHGGMAAALLSWQHLLFHRGGWVGFFLLLFFFLQLKIWHVHTA